MAFNLCEKPLGKWSGMTALHRFAAVAQAIADAVELIEIPRLMDDARRPEWAPRLFCA